MLIQKVPSIKRRISSFKASIAVWSASLGGQELGWSEHQHPRNRGHGLRPHVRQCMQLLLVSSLVLRLQLAVVLAAVQPAVDLVAGLIQQEERLHRVGR